MPKKICIFAVLCVLTISLPFYAFAAANGLDGKNGITHSIITDREIEKNTAKAEVFYDKHFEKDCKPEKICFGGSDETDFFMEDVGDFPVPLSMEAVYSDTNNINNEGSIYCWTPYLLSEGSYPAIREFFERFNITRVYQCVSEIYLEQEETAAMVKRLADDGIETVVLTGERSWGLAGSDLSSIKSYIDAVKAYNSGAGADAKIGKLALDVETYTYSDWKKDSAGYFADYIINMKEIYNYAHEAGLEVVQVIPVHFDTIDEGMFREYVETCCDEISIMNYTKSTQVNAIEGEIELCRELGMKIETIFETMPYSEYFDVTEENTYFYEGLEAMMQKRSLILQAYNYEKLSASYHHFPTMYHVATGSYMAEIYAYTNSEDPSRNSLGQTYELETLILYGDDGSMIQAGLYNPNLGAKYEENCYLAVGVKPGVTYTVTAGADNYTVTTPEKSFTYEDGDLIDYTSIRIKRIENETPEICSHVPELINVKEAGCLTEGYTGDTVCTVCGKILKTGQAAAATGHEPEYVSNIDGTHTIGCTKCEYMTSDFDCADNNGDGYCDCCGYSMAEAPCFVEKTYMSNGGRYIIVINGKAIDSNLLGTNIAFNQDGDIYRPDTVVKDDMLWIYENGKLKCEKDGSTFYLSADATNRLKLTGVYSSAVQWTYWEKTLSTKLYGNSGQKKNGKTLYLNQSRSGFTLSSKAGKVSVYEMMQPTRF